VLFAGDDFGLASLGRTFGITTALRPLTAALRIARAVQTIAIIVEERAEHEEYGGHGDVRLLVQDPVERGPRPSDDRGEHRRVERPAVATRPVATRSTRPAVVAQGRGTAATVVVRRHVVPPLRAFLVRVRPVFVAGARVGVVRRRVRARVGRGASTAGRFCRALVVRKPFVKTVRPPAARVRHIHAVIVVHRLRVHAFVSARVLATACLRGSKTPRSQNALVQTRGVLHRITLYALHIAVREVYRLQSKNCHDFQKNLIIQSRILNSYDNDNNNKFKIVKFSLRDG